jgi:hypothetical protein
VRSRCCVCVSVYPRSLLGHGSVKVPLSLLGNGSVKIPLIFAGQRLGKNPPIFAGQRLDKNPSIISRQQLGRDVTAVTNMHATKKNCLTRRFQYGPCRIKESRRLVLPRISCSLYISTPFYPFWSNLAYGTGPPGGSFRPLQTPIS